MTKACLKQAFVTGNIAAELLTLFHVEIGGLFAIPCELWQIPIFLFCSLNILSYVVSSLYIS